MSKKCGHCQYMKPLDAFTISRSRSNQLEPCCRECVAVRRLRNKYQLSWVLAETTYNLRTGVCHLCEQQSIVPLCLDHDHKTGQIRGMLCVKCNRGLGQFRDDPDLLRKAALYVEEYNG